MSLGGKLTLLLGLDLAIVGGAAAGASAMGLSPAGVLLAAVCVGAPVAAFSMSRFWGPVEQTLDALTDGARSFQENDFGMRIAQPRAGELAELVELYNSMGDVLRRERNEIYQRELLLETLLQASPMAILLVDERHRISYSNGAARALLAQSRRLTGKSFASVLEECPSEVRRALEAEEDALFTWPREEDGGGEGETYRVINRRFRINTQERRLVVVERMTAELKRQEVEVWKKVIRVMSHELNNSLAPVRSLIHSARLVQARPESPRRMEEILDAVEERVRHLCDFLEGYARFARLPRPRKEPIDWRPFLEKTRGFFPFRLEMAIGRDRAHFDPAQMQQVLINLLKNAAESGTLPGEIVVALERPGGKGPWLLHVLDRGKGMDEGTMKKALLPFYSSKQSGSGLGLPLCTEILASHGGSLRLQSRPGGGLAVTCVLPDEEPAQPVTSAQRETRRESD